MIKKGAFSTNVFIKQKKVKKNIRKCFHKKRKRVIILLCSIDKFYGKERLSD